MARRIEQIQRNKKNRRTKENILFEFEGKNKTEEIYFRNFQKRSNPYNLKFAYGNDTDPVSMVKSLISYMKKEDINTENDDKIAAMNILELTKRYISGEANPFYKIELPRTSANRG